MKCLLCRYLIGSADPGWIERVENELATLRNAGANSDAIFERESDPERLRRAHDLWDLDPKRAFDVFLNLAQGGSVWSMAAIGWAYETGTGTPFDSRQADEWYRRACEGGSDAALLGRARLARMHGDPASAEDILKMGVARGLPQATRRLADLKLTFDRTARGRATAYALLDQACAKGDQVACHDLARAMAKGRFGPRYLARGFLTIWRLGRELQARAHASASQSSQLSA
ncbi:tetratricopeptide repeat protein [Bosea sp. (in: a-proteobacteria)]|jgi:TPR repeat protein|uniref:tetratricopeptide repeat protein n=1 Tax=Bosea sp. (in: a-proteobacteria) TaxID=1871050 RepID=UPI00356A15EF